MGIYIFLMFSIVVVVGIGLAVEERNDVQKRQAQIEKDLQELKEIIKEKHTNIDVEV
jgi:hypothetical protein